MSIQLTPSLENVDNEEFLRWIRMYATKYYPTQGEAYADFQTYRTIHPLSSNIGVQSQSFSSISVENTDNEEFLRWVRMYATKYYPTRGEAYADFQNQTRLLNSNIEIQPQSSPSTVDAPPEQYFIYNEDGSVNRIRLGEE
jgi:hypothetical protein